MDNKFIKWDDKVHHPNERCITNVRTGQCPHIKMHNTDHCNMHGAHRSVETQVQETKRNYQLRRWQERVNNFADNDSIKSLREEIGILRMTMEEMLNKCDDATDVLMMSHRIGDTAMKIEKLVVSCDKLETRMGELLSKRAVVQLAGTYVNIINNYITDPEVIEQISLDIIKATDSIESHALTES